MSPEETVARSRLALAVPLAAALGAELRDPADPSAGVRVTVAGLAGNGAGGAHAAALTAVLELAAYLALLPALQPDEHAVSHALTVQLPAAAPEGGLVEAVGQLDRRGRRLAFLSATAEVSGTLVARAQITKSIVPLPGG
ncbi:thioesterase, FlK family [Geodermatophilus sp. DSM 44513]|uniref:thioesterase, FlK family n=1 Tax=Geodermatophilus sp. DSM 44513 TaxID=1528104 RepID=UPI001274CB4D|nr:PaaI family thioesterase [Geodermatophilus sp. DSM 44513]WNV77201.1 PaaI family thioesterase [Geodermatophilus sp. DSM 44513]